MSDNTQERLVLANNLIEVIASTGRHFFRNGDTVSRFELDSRSRLWLLDCYGARIYLHYKYWQRGFSGGGTLRNLINALKAYILVGYPVPPGHFGPWPQSIHDGDLWGYGADMETVRAAAEKLYEVIATKEGE